MLAAKSLQFLWVQTSIPRTARACADSEKSPSLAGFCRVARDAWRHFGTQRIANRAFRLVENPWSSFAGCSR